ncbi:hypothetical protein [Ruegeria halocynthiae]|uniref:hypothetical protein n=1 Tax=Ruegeria halocynthiae TaxID=985054 RepID=UPI0005658FFF|nr:hypothetical protein [Ruegeria halocynthiae]
MLGYLVPDPLQRLFVSLVGSLPLILQQVGFALLCAGFLLVISYILRLALLHLDVHLALQSQRRTEKVSTVAYMTGWTGKWQWCAIIGVCAVMLSATVVFSVIRSAKLDPASPAYSLVRTVQICLAPNSGNGDTMARCLKR